MIILSIETSCDETAAAIVKDGTQILSSVVASSEQLHAQTGGIIPEVAAREQLKFILPIISQSIENCKLPTRSSGGIIENLTALAVTVGPGLIGSLIVGVQTTRTLSYLWKKPIVPVNHLPAHLYANFLNPQPTTSSKGRSASGRNHPQPTFPAIGLIASGGHTDLVLMKNHSSFKWLGGTRDDAAGECFDKCSRLLQLGYPGGPAIERAASEVKSQKSKVKNFNLPRPMLNQKNLDFSFSGLKTAVLNKVNKLKSMKQLNNETIEQLAYQIQEAITDCLVEKTIRAAQKHQVKSILLGGGVTANSRLKEKFQTTVGADPRLPAPLVGVRPQLFIPPPNLSTDNAASIASYAFFNYKPVDWRKILPRPNLHLS
jgi:N6-L-threonylcarbamoyladenine synthase